MELWSKEHIQTLLPSMVIMLLLSLLLRKLLIRKTYSVRMIPFQIVSVLFVLLEIGKQALSWIKGYDLYHLLFHFCSLVVLVVPVMAFYNGKYLQKLQAISASILTSVMVLMTAYPALIYTAGDIRDYFTNFFSFHTVSFHTLVVFAFFLFFALDLYVPAEKGEQKIIVVFILCFCIVSSIMAQLLQTNFNNFYSCNVPPLEDLRLMMQGILGYGLTQILYVLIVIVLNILFVLMSHRIARGLAFLIQGRKRSPQ